SEAGHPTTPTHPNSQPTQNQPLTPSRSVDRGLTTATPTPTHHTYDPYGLPRTPDTTTASPTSGPGYIGGLKLPSGNYLLGQREYNPATGTFLTPDQGGSSNPYAYTSGNPLKSTDLQGLSDIEGTLTDVSQISAWTSTAALAAAITCTALRPCAPAIPILMQVSAATGVLSAGTSGVLSTEACVLKGNCSQLAADIAVGTVASRLPAIGRVAQRAAAARDPITVDPGLKPDLATVARREHILHGDSNGGGGHLWPGKPGKTVFPKRWSDDKVMSEISDIATDPTLTWVQQTGPAGADFTRAGDPVRYYVDGIRDGIEIRVILEPSGEGIITGYPLR
ncbi:EndoU domain-containing protein, partial [Kribbella sp. NPDC050124]|uniref:EndoU domain-containing protein n=1 Tax=Kribbella sp. NPDC050124 TaxID=3364114 RepID=UPI0037AFCC53